MPGVILVETLKSTPPAKVHPPPPGPPASLFFGPPWLHVLFIMQKNSEMSFWFKDEQYTFCSSSWGSKPEPSKWKWWDQPLVQFRHWEFQTLRQNHTVLHRAALSGPERAPDSARWGRGRGLFSVSLLLEYRNLLPQTMKTNAWFPEQKTTFYQPNSRCHKTL